ncbi:MAG: UDP-2,3-diacylglucosamine pyrophosphatase LpxI [Myxococcota bacterium]|nr:UDP-2,3-diacylglucosamine pyrophosphatase LpxI [Myxococcota bacterium]
MSDPAPIGVIAGNGALPLAIVRRLAENGRPVIVVAHEGETDPAIAGLAPVRWIHVGQIGALTDHLLEAGASAAVFAGGVRKTRLFGGARPDATAMLLLARLKWRGDNSLLTALADHLESNGVAVRAGHEIIPEWLAGEGPVTRRKPDAAGRRDIETGMEILRVLNQAEVGQAVAIHKGVCLAVEAIEGADALIARAGQLSSGGFVLVKAGGLNHDQRFDLPAIGPQTILNLHAAGARGAAVAARRAWIIEKERTIALADDLGLFVTGV